MADTLFIVPFQTWVYASIFGLAVRVWLFNRSLFLAGLLIEVLTDWMTTNLFRPSIGSFIALSRGLLPTFATIALFLLGIGYVITPFFQVRVVTWQKAFGWFLFALVFFQAGPQLYVEGEQLRRALSAEMYSTVLEDIEDAPTGSIGVLNSIAPGPDAEMGVVSNQFGAFVPTDQYPDGLDIAMAYTLSTGDEVVYAPELLPEDFEEEYFPVDQSPLFYLTMSAEERSESINLAISGVMRLSLAFIVIIFGLIEQAIYLCLAVAVAILFLNMGFAILFAFFERTELMARTLAYMWLELFLTSVIAALAQALIVGMVMTAARTANPTLTLGASTIGLLLMTTLFLKALGAIWDSMNRMFKAMSEIVGGGLMSPGELAQGVAAGAAGLALTAATAGAGAAVTVAAGGTLMQAAGSALSGMGELYRASAIGSMVLPKDSPLKDMATEFQEGALAQKMMPVVGGAVLGARRREAAETAPLTDAHYEREREAGKAVSMFRGDMPVQSLDGTATPAEVNKGIETDIRLDAADIAALRDALSTAMGVAILKAPTGGYQSTDQAWQAVVGALGSQSSWRAGMGEYLDRHRDAGLVGEYVQDASRSGARIPDAHIIESEKRATIRYGRLAAHTVEVDVPAAASPSSSPRPAGTNGSASGMNGGVSSKTSPSHPTDRH